MAGFYGRWIDRWETRLATRDTNRIVRPFDWGFDWLSGMDSASMDPGVAMLRYASDAARDSETFFAYEPPTDFSLCTNRLTFTSPVVTRHPENNRVLAQFFPVAHRRKRAVVVLPQWNSDIQGHVGLCKLLNRFGISALRMSLPYHDERKPAETTRADYHVSSNVGRTISAMRQSVIDVRACLDWLQQRGYEQLAILGSSLGSCVAFITAAHDSRIQAGVFNHVSMNVADVVWTGISTLHVKKSFEGHVTQADLGRYWAPISPASYLDRIAERKLKSLLIWAKYDTTFLPQFSRQVLTNFRERNLHHRVLTLPCAHYTTGEFPFKLLDGFAMCLFLNHLL